MESILMSVLPTILCSAVLAVTAGITRMIRSLQSEVKANNDATFVMLQNTILQSCKQHQANGYLPAHEGEMLQNLFRQYTAMHGNGYVAAQVEATLKLPQSKEA